MAHVAAMVVVDKSGPRQQQVIYKFMRKDICIMQGYGFGSMYRNKV